MKVLWRSKLSYGYYEIFGVNNIEYDNGTLNIIKKTDIEYVTIQKINLDDVLTFEVNLDG